MLYSQMPILHTVNNAPTLEKLTEYNYNSEVFYRLQDKKYDIGTQSWEMCYSSAEEAEEDGSTVLDGKSAWRTSREMLGYSGTFCKDSVVLVVTGYDVASGHDGESVVSIDSVLEIWSHEDFIEAAREHRYGS